MRAVPPSSRGALIGWMLLFAALAAWLLDDPRAGGLGAVAGYLMARLNRLGDELSTMRAQLEALSARPIAEPAAFASAAVSSEGAMVASGFSPQSAREGESRAGAEQILVPAELAASSLSALRVPMAEDAESARRQPLPSVAARPGWFDPIEAWLKRGNPLARLGVLITFFGAVFLIKYAAEEGYLPVEWRLTGLAVGAVTMVGIGWRLRDKASSYALTLQGGGFALLYLTVLAAFRFYTLIPGSMAFALLALVAAATAWLAVRQNALMLAAIGFAGGFVAPLLVGGNGGPIALFGYYTVLNLGVFVIAAYRAWSTLDLLGFVFTFVITSLWRATAFKPEWFGSTEFFLLLFFAMYVFVTVLNARQANSDADRRVSGTLTFGLPAIVLSLQTTIVRPYSDGLAWSAFGFGLFYLLLALALHGSRQSRLQVPKQAFIAIGVVLLSLAVPLHYDDKATAATWALEGAGAVWLGVRQQQRRARFFGVLIQLLAGGSLLLSLRAIDASASAAWLANGVSGALLLSLAGALSAAWLFGHRGQLAAHERNLECGAAVWALAWWLFAGLRQIDHLHIVMAPGMRLLLAAITALLLEVGASSLQWSWLRALAFVSILPFASAGLDQALDQHPLAHGGALGWPALFAAHFGLLWRRDRAVSAADGLAPFTIRLLHVGALWLLVLLASRELAWQIDLALPPDWVKLAYGLAPALLLLPIACGQPRWPLAAHSTHYKLWGAMPVVALLAGWIVLMSFKSAGDAAPLPTFPLLNPLDVTVACAIAAIGFWWRSLSGSERAGLIVASGKSWWPEAIAAALVFLWLNSALVRGLHYTLGTPLGEYGVRHSALVQAAFSIFWGSLGFVVMLRAARKAWREAWLAGAGLMVLVAIKLFVIDTAGTGSLSRIVAFLIVGALMLVTGYLAPLPPSRKPGAAEDFVANP